jgi:hypothetical protein
VASPALSLTRACSSSVLRAPARRALELPCVVVLVQVLRAELPQLAPPMAAPLMLAGACRARSVSLALDAQSPSPAEAPSLLAFRALPATSPCSSRGPRFYARPWPRVGALPLPRPASCVPATARSPSHGELVGPPCSPSQAPWLAAVLYLDRIYGLGPIEKFK